MNPPVWILGAMGALFMMIVGLFVRKRFFVDQHGIKRAADQHVDLTKLAIEHFRKGIGSSKKFEVIWCDTIVDWENPRVEVGRTAVIYEYQGEKRAYHGLMLGGVCYVAWRGSIAKSALFHELAHAEKPFQGGHDAEGHFDDEIWEQKWKAVAATWRG